MVSERLHVYKGLWKLGDIKEGFQKEGRLSCLAEWVLLMTKEWAFQGPFQLCFGGLVIQWFSVAAECVFQRQVLWYTSHPTQSSYNMLLTLLHGEVGSMCMCFKSGEAFVAAWTERMWQNGSIPPPAGTLIYPLANRRVSPTSSPEHHSFVSAARATVPFTPRTNFLKFHTWSDL